MREMRAKKRYAFGGPVAFESFVLDSGSVRNISGDGLGDDISDKGLGMTTGAVLYKGEVLRVNLPVDAIGATLPAYAEVIWTKPRDGHQRVGLRFLV